MSTMKAFTKADLAFRMMRPRLFGKRPMLVDANISAYQPPQTDAQAVNPWNGELSPITSVSALILFASPADVARLMPLFKNMDPNVRAFDGQGIVCPEVQYGKDGRTIACVQGAVTIGGTMYQYEAAIGIMIAAAQWGPAWNGGHQGPYTKLVCDAIDPVDAQVNWS